MADPEPQEHPVPNPGSCWGVHHAGDQSHGREGKAWVSQCQHCFQHLEQPPSPVPSWPQLLVSLKGLNRHTGRTARGHKPLVASACSVLPPPAQLQPPVRAPPQHTKDGAGVGECPSVQTSPVGPGS